MRKTLTAIIGPLAVFAAMYAFIAFGIPLAVRAIFTLPPAAAARTYERDWDIIIPPGFKEARHFPAPGSEAYGYRYTVYRATGNAQVIYRGTRDRDGEPLVAESSGTSVRKRQAELELLVRQVAVALEVPREQWPDFAKNYVWRELEAYGSRLAIVYSPDASTVYLAEGPS